MAEFNDHIEQAKKNLIFLQEINNKIENCIDWQITVCFYSGLHLINAHLSTFDLHYRSHSDVKYAINPENATSLAKLPEDQYVAYSTLQMLSRRSRYLVSEKDNNLNSKLPFLSYEKHLAKAFNHLDNLIYYFNEKYKLNIGNIEINCESIRTFHLLKHLVKVK